MAKTKIGRNQKCPCGSGKKYKNCCMSKKNTTEIDSYGYSDAERDLVSLIMFYARSKENENDFENAIEMFFGGEFSELNINNTEFSFFMTWYIKNYNYKFSFIDRIIKKNFDTSNEVKQLLSSLKDSGMYMYKIKNIKDGKIYFKNLHNDSEIEVIDSVIEQSVNIEDTIYTRVYRVGKYYKIFGGTIAVPKFMVDKLIDDIDRAYGEIDMNISYDDFLQIYSLDIINKLGSDILDDTILYNEDDELLQYSILKYKILDRDRCISELNNIQEFLRYKNDTEILYRWIKYKNKSEFVIGEITVSDSELKVETDSFERKEKFQKLLEKNLSGIISFEDENYFTLRQLQDENSKAFNNSTKSDEIERLILKNMKNEYRPTQIRDAIFLAKKHRANLKRLKSESVAAAIEYSIANKEKLPITQKDIAYKYNISSSTVGKWAKYIQQQIL